MVRLQEKKTINKKQLRETFVYMCPLRSNQLQMSSLIKLLTIKNDIFIQMPCIFFVKN